MVLTIFQKYLENEIFLCKNYFPLKIFLICLQLLILFFHKQKKVFLKSLPLWSSPINSIPLG